MNFANYAAQASAPIAAVLPQIWIDSLLSNRWNYRRAALLFALANMDGQALIAAYQLANQYRIVMDRAENELLDRIAQKISGLPDGLGAALGASYAANDLMQRGYLYAVQTGALAPHTIPVPTYGFNREIVPRAWAGKEGCACGCGGSCGCGGRCGGPRRVGLGFATGEDFPDMEWGGNDGSNTSSTSSKGGQEWGEEGGAGTPNESAWGDDGWGTGNGGSSSDPFGGGEGESGSGWGGSGWGEGESESGGASNSSDPFGGWGTPSAPSTPKKPPVAKAGAKNWWEMIPSALKAATDTATKAYCFANPNNPACGTVPQNSPEWLAYCRTNAAYPPCAQMLKAAGVAPLPTAPIAPQPTATGWDVPAWVWAVGGIALIALALVML